MRWIILLFLPAVYAQTETAQIKRGRAIFFESDAGTRCANCHALEGKGTAVGPDLTRLAMLNPRAIKMAVLSTVTQYVTIAKTKTGESFPSMKAGETDAEWKLYDMSTNPPTSKTVAKAALAAFEPNATWKHPPESAHLTAAQLADVISYMRFAAKGDTRGVKPEEVD